MAIYLAPQRIRFVGEVAKPDHEKLGPEQVNPQQHERADQHAELANLAVPELVVRCREPAKHCWYRHHGGRCRKHVTEPEVNGKHGAVPVWDQHHGKIPREKGIADHEGDKYQRGQQIKLTLDLTMFVFARSSAGVRFCSREVGAEGFENIECTQAVEQQQAKEVPEQ